MNVRAGPEYGRSFRSTVEASVLSLLHRENSLFTKVTAKVAVK